MMLFSYLFWQSLLFLHVESHNIFGSNTFSVDNGEITVDVSIPDADINSSTVIISITCPIDQWCGIGFDGTSMSSGTYVIFIDGSGSVYEGYVSDYSPGELLSTTITVFSSKIIDNMQQTVITRSKQGISSKYYTFPSSETTINVIYAVGYTTDISYHNVNNGNTDTLFFGVIPTTTSQPTNTNDNNSQIFIPSTTISDIPTTTNTYYTSTTFTNDVINPTIDDQTISTTTDNPITTYYTSIESTLTSPPTTTNQIDSQTTTQLQSQTQTQTFSTQTHTQTESQTQTPLQTQIQTQQSITNETEQIYDTTISTLETTIATEIVGGNNNSGGTNNNNSVFSPNVIVSIIVASIFVFAICIGLGGFIAYKIGIIGKNNDIKHKLEEQTEEDIELQLIDDEQTKTKSNNDAIYGGKINVQETHHETNRLVTNDFEQVSLQIEETNE